jgi:hypothetical protein
MIAADSLIVPILSQRYRTCGRSETSRNMEKVCLCLRSILLRYHLGFSYGIITKDHSSCYIVAVLKMLLAGHAISNGSSGLCEHARYALPQPLPLAQSRPKSDPGRSPAISAKPRTKRLTVQRSCSKSCVCQPRSCRGLPLDFSKGRRLQADCIFVCTFIF